MKVDLKLVTLDTWHDLEKLFEGRGGPHNCWCMVWRKNLHGNRPVAKAEKKEALYQYIKKDIPIGILAYADDQPVGWCSVAPRDTYRSLGGDETKEKVWSLACFFVHRSYRQQGLTLKLVEKAIETAKNNGGKYIEAYPVEVNSPSYRFMGFKPVFERLGFEFIKKAGSRRHVMLKMI